MSVLNSLKKVIHQLDLFCSSQLLRYKSQTQYKTLTGGLLSISIIIVIIVAFTSMISQTLQKTSIISSLTVTKQSSPSAINLRPSQENKFMAWGTPYIADFFTGPQHFTLTMNLLKSEKGILTSVTQIQLQQCTKQHWKTIPQFSQNIQNYGINRWACLPLNAQIPIQGVYTSPLYETMMIKVYRCKNSTINNNSCASESEIDAHFAKYSNFYLVYQYVNTVINPNLPNYKSYYIQSNDYAIFSKDIGAQSWIYLSDYDIRSDNSILPFQEIDTEEGFIVEGRMMNHPYGVTNNSPFITAFFAKSANTLTYKREVRKISAVFSYIGGLVGAITAVLFFINMYTDSSLEVTIGLSLFQQAKVDQKEMSSFNFAGFSRLVFYRFLKLFGWKGSWQIPEKLYNYQKEAVQQLDVQLLIKRLIKLQACMACLLPQEKLKQIRDEQRITMDNAKQMRGLLMKSEQIKQQKMQDIFHVQSTISMNKPNHIKQLQTQGLYKIKVEQPQNFWEDKMVPSLFSKSNEPSVIRLYEGKNNHRGSKEILSKNLQIHSLNSK